MICARNIFHRKFHNPLEIVRVDGDSAQRADLQIGENIIGVGVVTGCKDERVPEHAVTIDVASQGEMTISPLTSCYMKSPGSSGWVQLEVGSTVPICAGDLFSLLSDKYWFKVISVDPTMEDEDSGSKRKLAEDNGTDGPPLKKIKQDGSIEALLPPNDDLNDVPSSVGVDPGQEEFNLLDYEETATPSTEPTANDIYGASVPEEGKTAEATSSSRLEASGSRDSIKVEEPNESLHPSVAEITEDVTDVQEPISADEQGKKIKWDCGQHFSDRSDQNADNSAGVQDSENPVQSTSQENAAPPPVSDPVPSPPMRNRCTYGSRCYRKNEEHKAQFSHPGDADYETLDSRPECRFGIRCYRKNPQHRKDFKHTIQRRRRPQTPIRAQTPETTSATDHSSFEESIDESEYEPSFCTDSSDEVKSDWDDKSET